MAFFTVSCKPITYQLSFVVILVTIGTICKFQFSCQGLFMAGFTVNILMPAFQLVIGFGMIKGFEGQNLVKRFLDVALAAIAPKFIFMRVLMTIVAGTENQALKCLKFLSISLGYFMTFLTINRGVFSYQGKFGFFMIEGSRRFEKVLIMTV